MTKKPLTPLEFARAVERVMQSPVMRFLRGETPEAESPGDAQKETRTTRAEPPAQKRRRKHGPGPKYPREPLWQLYEEDPNRTIKELGKLYKDKTGFEVKDTWVCTHRVRPRG
jgi:hypothetical protein